jgi:hypothetical protein
MKTIYPKIMLFLLAATFIACEKENNPQKPEIDNSELLLGNWIRSVHNNDYETVKYERTVSLNDDDYGFSFQADKSFVERKNSGWCGTPPIAYENFDGTWSKNDSIVDISVAFWGGIEEYQWKIVALDSQYLTIEVIKREVFYNE